jgi:hypothetical protein
MSNWDKYKKTLDYLKEKINYYEEELKKYYETIIFNKKNNNIDEDILKLNPALFTYFNNIPDIFHPLSKNIYYDYVCYLSYVKPSFINKNDNDDIIKYKNILNVKYFKQKFMVKQDISPYNYFKRNLSINIKYFNMKKYLKNKYVILIYTDKNKKYIVKNEDNIEIEGNIVYVNVLRRIKSKELFDVFQTNEIKKGTKIYSFHNHNLKDNNLKWFSLDENNHLNDPYNIFYNNGDINYKYTFEIKKNIKVLNLSKNIFLENQNELDDLLNKYNKQQKNKIYNGFINYIKYYKNEHSIWNINRGKRLLHEILYKNSSFINLNIYYLKYLEYHNIMYLLYTTGFYEKLNKFYGYELGFAKFNSDLYKRISVDEIIISR